ncbi:GNAT family protein [Paenibacillus sp. Marseille-Q4541]|uniref:GNAT family N-acetyltransferase n=1 Tax=Paenibacillus sp. Marseille-Q4541 TaxID=2831522 RepID=UPI001BA7DED8|nr:GNAT family protein [Paenibacillus sp. Marseille-Q4541]
MGTIFGPFPVLQSDKLVLKKVEEEHVDELYEIYSNDVVFEYCGIIPKHNKETVKKMIGHFERDYNKQVRVKWGIFAAYKQEQLLGIIEVFDLNQKVNMATIGYFLAEAYWGKGYATEAVRLVLDFLFLRAGINRVQADVMPQNEVSKKVLMKNGFIKEGTLRQAALWSGKGVVDREVFGILKEEYVQNKQAEKQLSPS